MKHIILALFGCAILLAAAGCRSSAAVAGDTPEDQPYFAEMAIGDTILRAISENSYKLFRSQIAADQLKDFSENDFRTSQENMHKQFGKITAVKFLTALRTPAVTNLVWRISFERPGAGDDKKIIVQDMLFRLVTGKVDGRSKILSMGFI